MTDSRPPQITPSHLRRRAVLYIRQSTFRQVEENVGSLAHQRGQKAYALLWGWQETNIETIDQDLGLSGASAEHRGGWQRLLQLVSSGQVGIIIAANISRLSRSTRDFSILVQVCTEFDVLLAVDGRIVQFDDPHDAFMANIGAAFGQYDNSMRRSTLMKARWAKANLGQAVSFPPTGYVVSERGRWVKDPDMTVRQRIDEVFQQFELLGTVGKTLRFFASHNLTLPNRRNAGLLRWVPPSLGRIYRILSNPSYSGQYIYGRTSVLRGGSQARRLSRTHFDGCVVLPDHHEGYISPPVWSRNQARLTDNTLGVRQPVGPGAALCQGLIRCGRCGRRMNTQYYHLPQRAGFQYICHQAQQQYDAPVCWRVNGRHLDAVVAAELLRRLTPAHMDAVCMAANDLNAGHEAVCRQRAADLERVQYAADVAKKRLLAVNPENRLVAAGLEHDWQLALEAVRRVEWQQSETPLTPPLELTPETRATLQRLAADLPALWAAPSTTDQDRKELARLLVHEVRVVALASVDFEVEIAWVGGATSRHRVARAFAGPILIRELSAQGHPVEHIVEELEHRGIRKLSGAAYTSSNVSRVIRQAARQAGTPRPPWSSRREALRAPLRDLTAAGWSGPAIAAEFNRRGLQSARAIPWDGQRITKLLRRLGIPPASSSSIRVYKTPLLRGRTDLRDALTELTLAGWSSTAIAAEFTRRGLQSARATAWNRRMIRDLYPVFGLRGNARPRFRVYKAPPLRLREDLHAPLEALVQAGWRDAAIAREFNQRGLGGAQESPWNAGRIKWLRRTFGLVRGTRSLHWLQKRSLLQAHEDLRAPLTALVQAGWRDAAIAAEFTRRGLPSPSHPAPWDRGMVANLRHGFGIPSAKSLHLPPPRLPAEAEAQT